MASVCMPPWKLFEVKILLFLLAFVKVLSEIYLSRWGYVDFHLDSWKV